eukprot:352237-Chlamydomonas_euryale.AAC.3
MPPPPLGPPLLHIPALTLSMCSCVTRGTPWSQMISGRHTRPPSQLMYSASVCMGRERRKGRREGGGGNRLLRLPVPGHTPKEGVRGAQRVRSTHVATPPTPPLPALSSASRHMTAGPSTC